MQFVDLLRRHGLVSSAAGGAVLGIIAGLFLPIRAASPESVEPLEWSLPSVQSTRRFDQADYESLKSAGFWNASSSARGARKVNSWVLRAIMTRPLPQAAVMAQGAATQTWVRIGGTLPDGATLVALDRDKIWFEQDGCRRLKRLYATDAAPSSTGQGNDRDCIGQDPPATAPTPRRPASSNGPAVSGATQTKGKLIP